MTEAISVEPREARFEGQWIRANALPVALVITGIVWLGPYWAWTHPAYFRLSVLFVTLAFLAALAAGCVVLTSKNVLLALLLVVLLLYFGSHRAHGVGSPSSGWLVLALLVLADDRTKKDALLYFSVAFAITLVPGIMVFALSALGINMPWHYIAHPFRDNLDLLNGATPD